MNSIVYVLVQLFAPSEPSSSLTQLEEIRQPWRVFYCMIVLDGAPNNNTVCINHRKGLYGRGQVDDHTIRAVRGVIALISPQPFLPGIAGLGLAALGTVYTLVSRRLQRFLSFPLGLNDCRSLHIFQCSQAHCLATCSIRNVIIAQLDSDCYSRDCCARTTLACSHYAGPNESNSRLVKAEGQAAIVSGKMYPESGIFRRQRRIS